MERELTKKNVLINETLREISTLYDALDQDLIEARNLQQSLVRERYRDFGAAQVSFRTCRRRPGWIFPNLRYADWPILD